MGMRGHLRQITPFELKKFQFNPRSVRTYINGKVRENRAGFLDALQRLQPVSETVRALNLAPEEQKRVQADMMQQISDIAGAFGSGERANGLDLEKSWHVLHYLLTGQANQAPPPLGNTILGGKEIGDDLGYGPARFLTPDQVREVADALAAVSKESLASRFNLEAMIKAQIYPVRDDSELGLALEYFESLSRYYIAAAAAGNGMLLYIL